MAFFRNSIPKSGYLFALKKNYPAIFWVVLIFILLQLFFTFCKVETFPFLIFGMYSQHPDQSQAYPVLRIEVDGENYDYWQRTNLRKEMLITPLWYYYEHLKHNKRDPLMEFISRRSSGFMESSFFEFFRPSIVNDKSAIEKFEQWYITYFRQATGIKGKCLTVYVDYYKYEGWGIRQVNVVPLIACE